jgi:CubicO group peptidase (beta-lactamase class C family)
MRPVIALALLLAVAAPRAASGQPTDKDKRLSGFDSYVAQAVADWRVPGLAVAIVKDGELVFAKGYGLRELGKTEAVSDRTLFAIGSTTKAMTAAAVGMLVDAGKVRWDDRVIDHLPAFRLYDPYVTREVTVRDLLTHRAGLGNADFLWYGADAKSADIIRRLRFVEPETSLRSHFTYQNIMYAAAGELVAAVSGQPWDEFVRTRIFAPIGMTDTIATAATLARQPNVASPHFDIGGTVTVIRNASVDPVAPAGAVWSNVHDMSLWLRFLLNGCKTGADATPLLKPDTCAELFKPQMMVGTDQFYPTARVTAPHWTTYGLGWFQEDYAGRAMDFHTGSIDGMVAIAGLIRDERLGIIVLANLDHAEVRHALMYRVFDLFGPGAKSKDTLRDWSAELRRLYAGLASEANAAREKVDAARVTGTKPSLASDRYAGTYASPLYGTVMVSVSAENGALRLRYGSGFDGTLEHWHYDTFKARWTSAWLEPALVTFALDARGVPATLEFNGLRFTRQERP